MPQNPSPTRRPEVKPFIPGEGTPALGHLHLTLPPALEPLHALGPLPARCCKDGGECRATLTAVSTSGGGEDTLTASTSLLTDTNFVPVHQAFHK